MTRGAVLAATASHRGFGEIEHPIEPSASALNRILASLAIACQGGQEMLKWVVKGLGSGLRRSSMVINTVGQSLERELYFVTAS